MEIEKLDASLQEIDAAMSLWQTAREAEALGLNPQPAAWELSAAYHETVSRHVPLLLKTCRAIVERGGGDEVARELRNIRTLIAFRGGM